MTDHEIAALAAAFKTIVQEQTMTLQAQIASLRQDLALEISKGAERRRLAPETHRLMAEQMAAGVVDAIKPHLSELRRRSAELEQRVMPNESTLDVHRV